MGKPLSEDARNSLIALVCVTLLLAILWAGSWLLRDVELPRWTPFAAFGVILLNLLIVFVRWRTDRRKRKKADAGPG